MSELRHKAASGVFWSAVERFSQQGVVFLVQIVMARLLEPAQFGLIAMVSVFILLSSTLVESGLGLALIQQKDISETDISTVFYFNLTVAFVLVATLWAGAPMIAVFYNQPELTWIIRWLSLSLLLGAAGSVQGSILRRGMQFKSLFGVSTPASLFSGCVGIGLALRGAGVWALVGQTLAQRLATLIMLWTQSKWRPALVFDPASLLRLLPFSVKMALAEILNTGFANVYVFVMGRFYSPVEVGFYQRANSFRNMPMQNLQAVIGSVSLPLLASIQHDYGRMRNVVKRAVQMTTFLAIPLMAFLIALAKPVVLLLVGEKWAPCAPILQVLCIAGAMYPIHAININLLMALGRSDAVLRLQWIKMLLAAIGIVCTYRFGLIIMVWGMFATSVCALVVNTYYTKRDFNYGLRAQFGDMLPGLLVGLVAFLGANAIVALLDGPAFAKIAAGGAWVCCSSLLALRFLPASMKHEVDRILAKLPRSAKIKPWLLGGAYR